MALSALHAILRMCNLQVLKIVEKYDRSKSESIFVGGRKLVGILNQAHKIGACPWFTLRNFSSLMEIIERHHERRVLSESGNTLRNDKERKNRPMYVESPGADQFL
jgi:hypothetical protein